MKKPIFLSLAAILLASPIWAQTQPQIAVSTTNLAFNGSSGNASQQPLTISSIGTAPLVLQKLTFSNVIFSNSSIKFPVTLQPKQTIQFQVIAQPSPTAVIAGLTFVSNSQYQRSVHLSETATTATSTHQASLSWNAPTSGSAVQSYNVDRLVSGSTTYSNVASTNAATRAWADKSVQSGKTYSYRVRALDQQGDTSQPSNTVTVKIP